MSFSEIYNYYVSCSGSVTSVGEERESFFFLYRLTCNYVVSVRRFPLPLGAWDRMRCFRVALPVRSI